MNGTGVRAGVLKAATGPAGADRVNEKVLRAIARVHRETGVPIGTHTDMSKHTGLDQQRIFADEGVDLGRVFIGHSNDTSDVAYLEQLIDNGSYISMDRFGLDLVFSEQDRIDLLVEMCRRGYADRIVLGHDANCGADWAGEALQKLPHWNWHTIMERILPEAKRRGVTDAQIQAMTIDNPRQIFERQGAY
jgi:phosphotriesterase-related protein